MFSDVYWQVIAMCEFCNQEPVFDGEETEENYLDYASEKALSGGGWTTLFIGVDAKGRIVLRACGDGYTDNYYPNFCPVCGRDLRKGKL